MVGQPLHWTVAHVTLACGSGMSEDRLELGRPSDMGTGRFGCAIPRKSASVHSSAWQQDQFFDLGIRKRKINNG